MTSSRFPLLLVACALPLSAFAADDAAREQTLRFPEHVLRNAPYAEVEPDSDYRHAPESAYEAFRDLKYGVRIHWGLYSMFPDTRESWTFLAMSDAERQAYLESYQRWNPEGFDAGEWMKFFARAGFKTWAMTTKHHEGFSLWDTKTRVVRRPNYSAEGQPRIESCDVAYSVMETPFRRDIIKELCDASRAYDFKINLYYSHSDWYDADFRPYGRHPLQYAGSPGIQQLEERQKRPAYLVAAPAEEERARLVARHRAQLKELLTNFGKVDMICLDINLGAEVWPGLKRTIKELRALQPHVMFRNRGIANYGDYHTPERSVPPDNTRNSMPWMVIYPLGTNFSYEADAAKHKGAKWVIDNLVDSVAKGGNFMVGIGPDGTGRFHPTAVAQLEEVGAWLKVNGEGIFATRGFPDERYQDGEFTRMIRSKDGRHTFAVLLRRPAGKVTLRFAQPPAGATVGLLGHSGSVKWRPAGDGMEVELPASAPDSHAYVLKIPNRL